jgi:fused signal recognition particle receptor
MARSWTQLLGDSEGPYESEAERSGFFGRLRDSLSRSRRALGAQLVAAAFDPDDDEAWERLEETLIAADVGVPLTARIVERLELEAGSGDLPGGERFTERLIELLAEAAVPEGEGEGRLDLTASPAVVMAVGVNGTGKTTTIGKLAFHLQRELGLDVLLAAGDTYRAAAVEQLAEWADRAGCDLVRAEQGSDPGAVAFDALEAAAARGKDVVIVDTAGRLHTQQHLMDELRKIRKVIGGRINGAPHETLLTIDATTGQNGLRQADLFREAVDVTGVVLTKLDGTARGGVALAVSSELGLPVKLIGTGEQLDDLSPFDARDFAAAIIDTGPDPPMGARP